MEHEIDPLIAAAQRGDRDAFRRLVEAHSHSTFRVTFRVLGDEAAAEDAVQETFLSAYRRLASFDGRAQFSTWLHRIAVNRAIDLRRKRRRDRSETRPAVDEPLDAVSEAPRPDRLLASKQVGDATRRGLDLLSDLERTAFVLRHVDGCSIAEIGAELDLKPSATKQAIFRAVHKLRRALEPWVRMRDEATV
ncbi:MAG: RNA polymerase sigma factor [Acidobacteriota bacterium]